MSLTVDTLIVPENVTQSAFTDLDKLSQSNMPLINQSVYIMQKYRLTGRESWEVIKKWKQDKSKR